MLQRTSVSPFDIAEDTVAIDIPQMHYNPIAQSRYNINDPKAAITWNQTQTYDFNGRPSDMDNDN